MLVEEKIISKELAFLAYDKGFDCCGYSAFIYESKWYEEDDSYELEELGVRIPNKYWDGKLKFCPQSLLQKWLREVHNIHIEIEVASDYELNMHMPYIYQFFLYKDGVGDCNREFYESYEDCLEKALMFALSLIHSTK